MWGVVHRVHEHQGADGSGEGGGARHVVHGSNGVRGCADGQQPSCDALIWRRRLLPVELTCARHDRGHLTTTPRSRARARHGSMFAWCSSSVTTTSSPGPHPRPSARPRWNVRSSCWHQHHLVGCAFRNSQRPVARSGWRRRSRDWSITPVRVGVVMEQVLPNRIGHLARYLRATRSVEVRDAPAAVRPLQRRKVVADLLDGQEVVSKG